MIYEKERSQGYYIPQLNKSELFYIFPESHSDLFWPLSGLFMTTEWSETLTSLRVLQSHTFGLKEITSTRERKKDTIDFLCFSTFPTFYFFACGDIMIYDLTLTWEKNLANPRETANASRLLTRMSKIR